MQSIGTWMLGAKVSGELNIGRQGENLVSFLILDAKQYIAAYGAGTIQVRHLRSGDTSPYPVAELERKGDQFLWTITSGDTAMVGDGLLEVRWYVGDALKISQTRKTRVEPTMQEDSTIPPDVWDGYLDRIHRSGAAVEAAAQEAIQRFDETVDQTTKDTVALVEKTGSNQVSNVKAQEKKSLQAVKDLTAESKQTLETLRSDGVSAIQTQEQSSLNTMRQQEEKGLRELRELSETEVKAVTDTADSGLKAIRDTTAFGIQSLVDTKTAGVKEITDTSEKGLKQTAEQIHAGLRSISEAQSSGTKAVEEKAASGLQEMENLRTQGVKELTETTSSGVDAVSRTASSGVSAVQQTADAGVGAVKTQEEVSVGKVTQLGESYLEQARQAALSNGYAAFDVDEEGNAWLTRTANVVDKLDFAITDEGELEVIILG